MLLDLWLAGYSQQCRVTIPSRHAEISICSVFEHVAYVILSRPTSDNAGRLNRLSAPITIIVMIDHEANMLARLSIDGASHLVNSLTFGWVSFET